MPEIAGVQMACIEFARNVCETDKASFGEVVERARSSTRRDQRSVAMKATCSSLSCMLKPGTRAADTTATEISTPIAVAGK